MNNNHYIDEEEKNTKKNRKTIKEITTEYNSKLGMIDPSDKSPNLFMEKLQYRMKKYYSTIHQSNSFNIKMK